MSRPTPVPVESLPKGVVAVGVASLLMTFGEELWKRFVPKYLEALGAPVTAIGAYGTIRDTLDGLYQYPGGWIADHLGRRRALQIFIGVAAAGYLLLALAPTWQVALLGVVLMMAWCASANPALFAVIGDALARGKRISGFTLQSMLRRAPILIAPIAGGALMAARGVESGVRLALLATIALAAMTLAVLRFVPPTPPTEAPDHTIDHVWRHFPPALSRLLASDVLVRFAEGMVDVLLVIYATNVVGIGVAQFGVLISVQVGTSLLIYLPAMRLGRAIGQKALVTLTFIAFAAFPLAVVTANSFEWLLVAFVIGGLREIGEPARKAMIVDLADPRMRARSVGLYYLIRSLSIAPAGVLGAFLWLAAPSLPFVIAAGVGLLAAIVFVVTVRPHEAA